MNNQFLSVLSEQASDLKEIRVVTLQRPAFPGYISVLYNYKGVGQGTLVVDEDEIEYLLSYFEKNKIAYTPVSVEPKR